MIGLGIAVSAVAVFVLSSHGRWKAISELLRTAVLASALAYLLRQSDALDVSRASALAVILGVVR